MTTAQKAAMNSETLTNDPTDVIILVNGSSDINGEMIKLAEGITSPDVYFHLTSNIN